ncbi:Tn3 family transposase [Streptomyces sp. NPDC056231]|uniref:Tn3 family transposase n=1 Tax=Streptomyces sp. NPDC056231 TaxID=3345755 RepID=UPI003AAE2F47
MRAASARAETVVSPACHVALQRRLLLALFALGTNMGIRAIVANGEHGETEAALRHVRRRFITVDNLRAAVTRLVNGTFATRDAT